MSSTSPVRISLRDLQTDPSGQQEAIAQAFGSGDGCLGVILISDLPEDFTQLRRKLFHLIYRFANLPEQEREKLAREDTSYSFGWSHGKEVMNGKPDTQKGSYYANPLLDHPEVSDEKRAAHPEYYAGNVWPRGIAGMEEFEATFKALGQLIFDTGIALARACEPFVKASMSSSSTNLSTSAISLEGLIAESQANKARLLHYYPLLAVDASDESVGTGGKGEGEEVDDSLCGTHIDHSLLTGLCSALYLSNHPSPSSPTETTSPNPSAGLYIYPRKVDRPVQVKIPQDCLAFQIGEALQLLTGGRLCATPHFVNGSPAPSGPEAQVAQGELSRETFAFFLQPDVDDVVSPDGETFGEFTKRVLARHYAGSI